MESWTETDAAVETAKSSAEHGGGLNTGSTVLELPLGKAAETFDLEKAVCSHGLFMMAPNYWNPQSKTCTRPLRLTSIDGTGAEPSLLVRISQPSDLPGSLHLRVFGAESLSPGNQETLLDQVRRMLRLSETDEATVKDFWGMHEEAEKRGFARVFRSPTLFEDMVKCILLCNCQWPRTLSMAKALCELQLELQCPIAKDDAVDTSKPDHFAPITPSAKESTKKSKPRKRPGPVSRFLKTKEQIEAETVVTSVSVQIPVSLEDTNLTKEEECFDGCNISQAETDNGSSYKYSDSQPLEDVEFFARNRIGNFPTPREIAGLGENFLAKRCGLGYRASRILKLAQSIVEGKVQLAQLEAACKEPNPLNYSKLAEHLNGINGFGPYTSANVLVCMGFYHVIPSDSETIRHLKQVHARKSTIHTIQCDAGALYEKYAPFQFLAYWLEIWQFYEERFGKLCEMPHTDYKLITASNMKPRKNGVLKRAKITR